MERIDSRAREAMTDSEKRHVPAKCPSCGSATLVTTSKVVTASSYWRCKSCGDVWNAERLANGSRYDNRRNPWR